MSRIKRGPMALGVAAVAALLTLSGIAPANATYDDAEGVTSVNISVSCVEETPVATVDVAVVIPEGGSEYTFGVYIGQDRVPLEPGNPTRTATESGSFTFTGAVPVGETYVMVGGDDVAYESYIKAEACGDPDPELVPPTFTGLSVDAGCIVGNPDPEVVAIVSLDIPENVAEFTVDVVGPDGVFLNLVGFDGGTYYFAGFGSPGTATYTALLNGEPVGSKDVEVPSCATEPEPEPENPTEPNKPAEPGKPAVKPGAPIVNDDLPAPNTSSEDASAVSANEVNPVGVISVVVAVAAALGIGAYFLLPVIRRRLSTSRSGA